MEELTDISKRAALLATKKNSKEIQLINKERKQAIVDNVRKTYVGDEELIQRLIEQKSVQIEIKNPVIDVTNVEQVKTLEEFINEQREKSREEVSKITESLSSLINNATEENMIEYEPEPSKNQTLEELINPKEEKNIEVNQNEKEEETKYSIPKYFVIEIGDEENPIELVTDISGKDVGKIVDGKFEMNQDYLNDKLEKFNIDGYIAAKVHDSQTQQKIREEFEPKSLEELAQMDLDNGKEMMQNVDKTIEENENEIPPKEQEKGVKDKIDNYKLKEDEEEEKNNEVEDLSEDEKDDLEKVCDATGRSKGTFKRKLIILRPKSVTDTLDDDGLKERGVPIEVYEFHGGTGKEEYALVQGNRILDRRMFDSDIHKLMVEVKKTEGEVLEVQDNVTVIDAKTVDGSEKRFLAQAQPSDITQGQKEALQVEMTELSNKIQYYRDLQPGTEDFMVEFGLKDGIQKQCQIIDELEMEMYTKCVDFGIIPDPTIKTKAMEKTEAQDIHEEEVVENDEHDDHDVRVRGVTYDETGKPIWD